MPFLSASLIHLLLCSLNSLFSIPRNKRFVCVNTNANLRTNPLTESVNLLATYIAAKEKSGAGGNSDELSDSDDEIRPFKGFAKPIRRHNNSADTEPLKQTNRLLSLINEHVDEALRNGFDDSIAKYKGKSHFVVRYLFDFIN